MRNVSAVCGKVLTLSGCLSLQLFSSPALAQGSTLQSDWWVTAPKTLVESKALLLKGTSQWVKESLTVSHEFPTQLTGVQASLTYQVNKLVAAPEGRFALDVTMQSARMQASGLHVNGMVEKGFGSSKVEVFVKADCQNVVAVSQRPWTARVVGRLSGDPIGIVIEDVLWNQDQNLWSFSAESCQAPGGFMGFLNEQANHYWINSQRFKSQLMDVIRPEVNSYFQSQIQWSKFLPEMNSQLSVQATQFVDHGTHWAFKLKSEIKTQRRCMFAESGAVTEPLVALTNQALLLVPEGLVAKWAQCMHEQDAFRRVDDSRQTGFQRLMESSFAAWWVWPDLNRFPAGSRFDITSNSFGEWSFTPVADNQIITYRMKTNVGSQFVYKGPKGDVPYATLFGKVDSYIQMAKEGDQLVIKVRGTPAVTNFNFRWDLRADQISNTYVDKDRLRDEILEFIKTESLKFKLPSYELKPSGILSIQSLRRSGGSLQFGLDLGAR